MTDYFPLLPAARISKNLGSSQTLTKEVWAEVTFDVVDFTTDGYSSMADLANDQIVVPISGLYWVSGGAYFTNSNSGTCRALELQVNSVGAPGAVRLPPPAGVYPRYCLGVPLALDKDDQVGLGAFADASGQQVLSAFTTFLSIAMIDRAR